MHAAQCGCGSPHLAIYSQYPDLAIYSQRPDLYNYPWSYPVNQTPYYQTFWAGNQLPNTRHNLAGLPPFAVARADFYNQLQLSRGRPPLSATTGQVQSLVRRLSAAWSASYGR